jgi:hypothetical protein
MLAVETANRARASFETMDASHFKAMCLLGECLRLAVLWVVEVERTLRKL